VTVPFLSQLFGPQDQNVDPSLIPPEMLKSLGRNSLFNAGIAMLGHSSQPGATFGTSLATGLDVGRKTYQENIDQAERQKLLGDKAKEAERIRIARSGLQGKYAPQEGETPEQKVNRLTNAAYEYASYGDTETASELVSIANALRLSRNSPFSNPYTYMQKNGRIYQIEKLTGKVQEIKDDGSYENAQRLAEARLELQEAGLNLRGANLDIARERLGLARDAAVRPSVSEADTGLMARLAKEVGPVLDNAPAPDRLAWLATVAGVNEGLDANEQKFNVAANQFMDAYVRETSGAALNKDEIKRAFRIYIPQPGDLQPNLEYKKQLRNKLIQLLMIKGGRATKEEILNPASIDLTTAKAQQNSAGTGADNWLLNDDEGSDF
jgi:hypothetical protein